VFCLVIKTVEKQFNILYALPSAGTTTLLAQKTAVKHRITLVSTGSSYYQTKEQRNANQ